MPSVFTQRIVLWEENFESYQHTEWQLNNESEICPSIQKSRCLKIRGGQRSQIGIAVSQLSQHRSLHFAFDWSVQSVAKHDHGQIEYRYNSGMTQWTSIKSLARSVNEHTMRRDRTLSLMEPGHCCESATSVWFRLLSFGHPNDAIYIDNLQLLGEKNPNPQSSQPQTESESSAVTLQTESIESSQRKENEIRPADFEPLDVLLSTSTESPTTSPTLNPSEDGNDKNNNNDSDTTVIIASVIGSFFGIICCGLAAYFIWKRYNSSSNSSGAAGQSGSVPMSPQINLGRHEAVDTVDEFELEAVRKEIPIIQPVSEAVVDDAEKDNFQVPQLDEDQIATISIAIRSSDTPDTPDDPNAHSLHTSIHELTGLPIVLSEAVYADSAQTVGSDEAGATAVSIPLPPQPKQKTKTPGKVPELATIVQMTPVDTDDDTPGFPDAPPPPPPKNQGEPGYAGERGEVDDSLFLRYQKWRSEALESDEFREDRRILAQLERKNKEKVANVWVAAYEEGVSTRGIIRMIKEGLK